MSDYPRYCFKHDKPELMTAGVYDWYCIKCESKHWTEEVWKRFEKTFNDEAAKKK